MCFWDGHTAWIQVALQPMHASVWHRHNVEYLDLGGEGYSFPQDHRSWRLRYHVRPQVEGRFAV